MDRVKICHILPYVFELDANFSHTTRQILPQSDLAFNVRFELQTQTPAGGRTTRNIVEGRRRGLRRKIGAQIDVTHV